jgi:hypothetical protein
MSNHNRGYWISDKNVVHFNTAKMPDADAASFQILGVAWAKDAKHAFSGAAKIHRADSQSFQALSAVYAKDANRCYSLLGPIKDADPATFQALDDGVHLFEHRNGFGDHTYTRHEHSGFAADSTQVFHHVGTIGKPCTLKLVDRTSFRVLSCSYGRDNTNVYFEKSRLKKADPATFEVIPPHWGRDKNGVFYGNARLPQAHPATFSILSSHDFLTKDANHFYCRAEEIPREKAYPHGSTVPGYPLAGVKDATVAADYLRRGATPHDQLALHAACRASDVQMVKLLLDAGCNPKLTDADTNSCLTTLYGKNYLKIAKMLVEAGADPNHAQEWSQATHGSFLNAAALPNPLESALFEKRFDLADYLVSVGSDVNGKTGEGRSFIEHFRNLNNTAAVEYLLAKQANRSDAGHLTSHRVH